MTLGWIKACDTADVETEDVIRFDYEDRTFAIFRSKDDKFYATEGLCTHGRAHLADGMVMDNLVECPKHNGRFDYTTGQAKRVPACIDLKVYPVKVEGNQVYIQLAENGSSSP